MLIQRFKTFKYAINGLIDLVRTQTNARIHLLVAGLVILAAWFFEVSRTEWYFLIICIGLVISAEAFNTALEYLTDLVSPDYHPLAGKAKDVAAGAVLVLAITAAIVGLMIFTPSIWQYWHEIHGGT